MDRETLAQAYEEAGSVSELGRRLGIHNTTARYRLLRAGIALKGRGYKSPRTVEIAKGAAHHNWKGGTYRHADGYLYQYAPEHPAAASAKGYVLQHRLVMEAHLGRLLEAHEIVHHKNEDKRDNRLENLELTRFSPHMKGHKATAPRDAKGHFI